MPAGRRGPGRPRKYGRKRLSLAKRAGQARGWEQVQCWQYQQLVTKTVKTFAATWKPAGGAILVVLVKEVKSWRAYCCTDPAATARDILEAAAGRTAIEETFKDVKEVEGAGQQQLRYWRANVGAFAWCLWGYTARERLSGCLTAFSSMSPGSCAQGAPAGTGIVTNPYGLIRTVNCHLNPRRKSGSGWRPCWTCWAKHGSARDHSCADSCKEVAQRQ